MRMFQTPLLTPGSDLSAALAAIALGKPAEVRPEHVDLAHKKKLRPHLVGELRKAAAVNEHAARRHERLRQSVGLLEAIRTMTGLPPPERHSGLVKLPYDWHPRGPSGIGYSFATRLPRELFAAAVIIDRPPDHLAIPPPAPQAAGWPFPSGTMTLLGDDSEVSARMEAVALARLDGAALVKWWCWSPANPLAVVVNESTLSDLIELCHATGKKDSLKTRVTFA